MDKNARITNENHKKMKGDSSNRGISLYQLHNAIIMKFYDPDYEVPTIQEGDPTPVRVKKQTRDHAEDDEFISYFTTQYLKRISAKIPYVNKATVYRNITEPLRHHGLAHLKELLDSYFSRDDNHFKLENWNILTFLSMRTLNKLE